MSEARDANRGAFQFFGGPGSKFFSSFRSKSAHEEQHDNYDQDNAENTNATMTESVSVAAEATAKPTKQGDDKDDNKDKSQRHDLLLLRGLAEH